MTMRLLTVRQPWASLIINGFKPIENRTWSTDYRGDVGIIASTKVDDGDRAKFLAAKYMPDGQWGFLRGRCLGVVEMYDVGFPGMTTFDEREKEWFTGPYGFRLRNARKLSIPLHLRGMQAMIWASEADERDIRKGLVP